MITLPQLPVNHSDWKLLTLLRYVRNNVDFFLFVRLCFSLIISLCILNLQHQETSYPLQYTLSNVISINIKKKILSLQTTTNSKLDFTVKLNAFIPCKSPTINFEWIYNIFIFKRKPKSELLV